MKKFLALLLSVAMMLIPMSALAEGNVIDPTIDYYANEITIDASFDVELAGKIATLVVLKPGKTIADITTADESDAITWADQVAIDNAGVAEFVVDMTYASTDDGYTFVVAVIGSDVVYTGTFDYSIDEKIEVRDEILVDRVNSASNETAINTIIAEMENGTIAADILAVYEGIDEILEAYDDLDDTKPVLKAVYKAKPYADMDDFFDKLDDEIKKQAKAEKKKNNSSSGSGGGSGSIFDITVDPQIITPDTVVTNPFADIPDNFWAKDAILELYKKDIVAGQGDNTFNPNATITRAEFVQMVVKAFGFGLKGDAPAFADVGDEWFAKAVAVAYTNGIVKGTTETTFAPANNITRQDMMVILTNAAKAVGKTLSSTDKAFTDVAEISAYAQEAVSAMVGSGVVSGYTDGSVKPLANATRAEAAAMLNGLLNIK